MATSTPARIIGLKDRGRIDTGMKADLVIFDPRTITDRATYENPEELSEGIEMVLVNGQRAWEGQGPAGQPGRVLRR